MSTVIWNFFRNLGQQRVDMSVNRARGKVMSIQSRAKSGAANKFNKAVDAPGKAAKRAAKGGAKMPKGAKVPKGKKAQEAAKAEQGEGMGWFGKKKQQEQVYDEPEGYEEPEKTVAIDLNQIAAGTFQPVVGWMVVLGGELRGRDFRLVDGKNTVGTAADCDVVLTDPYLSSHHAVVRHENGEFTLVDLDSTNGCFLNDKRCSRSDLIDNDKIRFGRTEVKFKSLN